MAPVSIYPRHTIWPPTVFKSSSSAKRLPARCSFIFANRKNSDVARSELYAGCSKMSQWNCSRSKTCVCRAVCGDVHCRATEQFHARACLFSKISQDVISLQKTNDTSHLTVSGILNRHNHGHSYLCTYNATRSDVQLNEATFQHHSEHQKPMIGCNKTGARTVGANILYFLYGLRRFDLQVGFGIPIVI